MIIDGYLKGSERIHNQKKEISKDASGKLSMEELSVVSEDRLTESACGDGLFAAYSGKREAHGGKKTMED